jgi:hypothetical protein
MPAKIFPHLKLLRWLFMGLTLGFGQHSKETLFLSNLVFFLQYKQDPDKIIHS